MARHLQRLTRRGGELCVIDFRTNRRKQYTRIAHPKLDGIRMLQNEIVDQRGNANNPGCSMRAYKLLLLASCS